MFDVRRRGARCALFLSLGVAIPPFLVCASAAQQTQPIDAPEVAYQSLTDTRRSFTNLNVEVVRGFVVEDDASELFAINAYESTLMRFTPASVLPTHRWHTLNAPVSVAFHQQTLLVVAQGSHALARHDRVTGDVLDVLVLDSEPADIVVDHDNDEAWISCMGDDTVLQVSLGTPLALVKRWGVADGLLVKRPRFLHLELNSDATNDNFVYVAPMLSGNNTMVSRAAPVDDIFDGSTNPLFTFNPAFNGPGLPDFDVFRIRPVANVVEPVVRGAGSLVLAHGRNPATGDYWILDVDEINADPLKASEPALRGVFAENELDLVASASFPIPGAPPIGPTTTFDLDDTVPSTPAKDYVATRSVSFPYALDFHPSGWAAVASSTTPNVVYCDPTGARSIDLSLVNASLGIEGRVVRTVKFLDPFFLAYCQQTSNILVWTTVPIATTPFRALLLGSDPTPAPIREGRDIWYDARPSLDGRTTCNTCHPNGGADGLVWRIANVPVDDKGPMVTQPLFGIEDSFPYHWRGERAIEDFNGAFPGLLGHASKLSDPRMTRFREFVFSLQGAANALQDPERRVKDSLVTFPQTNGLIATPLVGDPTDGQHEFLNTPSDGALGIGTCVVCHANPTGTNGDFFPDFVGSGIPHRTNFEPTQFDNQIDLKRQPLVTVQTTLGSFPFQLLGSGFLHDGKMINLFDFNDFFFSGALGAQATADVSAFLHLWDTGLAPSAHWAARLDGSSPALTVTRIQNWLLNQSAQGWVGVVAFGTFPVGGTAQRIAWYYDPATARFVPEDASVIGPQPFSAFQGSALASNVFMGVPPGNEVRVGVDVDNDGLDTGGENLAGTSRWDADSDDDGFPDGYEVANGSLPTSSASTPSDSTPPALNGSIAIDFVNATQVKFHFQTDEPATWSVACTTTGGTTTTDSRITFDTIHTAVVHKLAPSTLVLAPTTTNAYTGTLTLTDLSGNTASFALPTFSTGSLIHSGGTPDLTVVGDLRLTSESRTGSTYSASARVRVDWRENSPPAVPAGQQVVIVQLLKQDPTSPAGAPRWLIVPAADIVSTAPAVGFTIGGVPYGGVAGQLPGPFLVLNPTTGSGAAGFTYSVANLTSGEPVMLNVIAVLPEPPGYNPSAPAFPGGTVFGTFQIPATLPANRNIESTL